MLEYWSPSERKLLKEGVGFTSKFQTDLYCLVKAKAYARSMCVSPDGSKFAILSSDDRVRLLRFSDGKLVKVFDETIQSAQELQQGDSGMYWC